MCAWRAILNSSCFTVQNRGGGVAIVGYAQASLVCIHVLVDAVTASRNASEVKETRPPRRCIETIVDPALPSLAACSVRKKGAASLPVFHPNLPTPREIHSIRGACLSCCCLDAPLSRSSPDTFPSSSLAVGRLRREQGCRRMKQPPAQPQNIFSIHVTPSAAQD